MNRLTKYIFSLSMLSLTNASLACGCLRDNLSARIDKARMIYTAKLIAANVVESKDAREWQYVEGTFQVHRVYKGKPEATVKLKTNTGGGDCGVDMIVAGKYVIFQGASDYIGICSGTSTVTSEYEDEIAKIIRNMGAKSTSNKGRQSDNF